MAALYRLVGTVSWWLGVLSLVAGFVMKFVRPMGIPSLGMIPHSLLFFAGVLFLCTLATRTMERSEAMKT
jgi:hypothetical protein